jgi:hypothetical protein
VYLLSGMLISLMTVHQTKDPMKCVPFNQNNSLKDYTDSTCWALHTRMRQESSADEVQYMHIVGTMFFQVIIYFFLLFFLLYKK